MKPVNEVTVAIYAYKGETYLFERWSMGEVEPGITRIYRRPHHNEPIPDGSWLLIMEELDIETDPGTMIRGMADAEKIMDEEFAQEGWDSL